MNQILSINLNNDVELETNNETFNLPSSTTKKSFHIQFILSIISIFVFTFFYFYTRFTLNQKENYSDILRNNYNISKLYSENSNSTFSNENHSLIIGMIEIPKLSLSYPIFSYLDNNLLEISPCKFFGEMPPISSNLCIAGHNYDNSKFFSNISSLINGDKIVIYNQSGTKFVYSVFNKYEVDDNDLSPIQSNYQSDYELTLITCNNLNNNRIVLKAKIEDT